MPPTTEQMLKKNKTYNSIRVDDKAKRTIKMLSSRDGKTEYDYANKMISFIHKTGLDVYQETLSNIPDLINNLDKRMVGFLKKRETDFFVPMEKSFREMIKLHRRTFEYLETMDVINYSDGTQKLTAPPNEEFSFVSDEEISVSTVSENTPDTLTSHERESLLLQLEKAEKEASLFKTELKYLLSNITPNKSISGPKFVCNLSRRDIERIKVLIGDH